MILDIIFTIFCGIVCVYAGAVFCCVINLVCEDEEELKNDDEEDAD